MTFAGCLDKLKTFNIPKSNFNFSLKVEAHLHSSPIPYPMKVSLGELGNNRVYLNGFVELCILANILLLPIPLTQFYKNT